MVQANIAGTEEKKYSNAITLFDKAISIAPYDPLSYFNRALFKEITLDYKGAIADMKKYLKLYPDATNARTAQDKIYEWEGKVKTTTTKSYTTSSDYSPSISSVNVKNTRPSNSGGKEEAHFYMKTGLNMPKSDFAKAPSNIPSFSPPPPLPPSQIDSSTSFLKNGNVGAQTGYFLEIGVNMKMGTGGAKVQFYYTPFLLGYSRNTMKWKNCETRFNDKNIYIKNLRTAELGQRYGISYEPFDKFLVAAYYRPAFVFPFLNFEVEHKGVGLDSTWFKVKTSMTSKFVMPLSHTFGFTVSYSVISISLESYFAQPTFDYTFLYIKSGTKPVNPDEFLKKGTLKVPFRTTRLGIAVTF